MGGYNGQVLVQLARDVRAGINVTPAGMGQAPEQVLPAATAGRVARPSSQRVGVGGTDQRQPRKRQRLQSPPRPGQ